MKNVLITIMVLLVLTKISLAQEVANEINIGKSIVFKSQVLKEDRTILVHLPDDYGPLRFYSIKEFTDFGGLEALKKHYTYRADKYQIPFDIYDDTKHYLLMQSQEERNFKIFGDLMKAFDGKNFIASYYKQARWFSRYAALYLKNDNSVESFDILELGLKKFPNASIWHNEMGNYYKLNGEVSKSRKWYKKAIAIAKKNDESEVSEFIGNLNSLK